MTRFVLFHDPSDPSQARAAGLFEALLSEVGAITRANRVDDLLAASADLLISLDPMTPKLTGLPSYLYLDTVAPTEMASRQFITHVLTYDAYLVATPADRQLISDLCFGARKRDARILDFLPLPPLKLPDRNQRYPLVHLGEDAKVGDWIGAFYDALGLGLPIVADHPALVDLLGGTMPMVAHDLPRAVAEAERESQLPRLDLPSLEAAYRRVLAEPRAERLLDFHAAVRAAKGYVGTGHTERVAIIVRCGRSLGFLRRALRSLAAQEGARITAILVLWRELDGLDDLLRELAIEVQIIHDPGGSRSHTLWTGLRYVAAHDFAYAGILDDDDELLANHIDRCLATLHYWSGLALQAAPRAVWSGVIERHETAFEHAMSTAEFADGYSTRLRLGSFSFNSAGRAVDAQAVIASNASLFSTALLDAEVLEDPGLDDVGEDTYLLRLLCERTSFAFTAEVTVLVHHHGQGQSEFWAESDGEAGRRVALRLFSRSYPVSHFFEAPIVPLPPAPLAVPLPRLREPPRAVLSVRYLSGADLAHQWTDASVLLETKPIAVPAGLHRLRWRLLRHDGAALAATCRSIAADGTVQPLEASDGNHCFLLPLAHAQQHFRLQLQVNPAGELDALSLAITHATIGLLVPWTGIPATQDIWIYGASAGGMRALGLLAPHDRARVRGFLDSSRDGETGGWPVRKASSMTPDDMAEAAIILASEYWPEMLDPALALMPAHLLVAYPFLRSRLRLLF